MSYSVLYQWPDQRIEWTPFCTRLRLALIWITHKQRDIFAWIWIKWTDYYWWHNFRGKFRFCVEDNWFRHRILNDSTFFFLKKEILLKTIIAVHRFDIHSSVWRKAKIFYIDHLPQADLVVRTVCLCTSPFQYKRSYDLWDQHRQDQHAHPHSLCIMVVWSGSKHTANSKQCENSRNSWDVMGSGIWCLEAWTQYTLD